MEVRAVGRYIRVQPRKVRIVAKEVKGKPAEHSAHLLRYHKSKGATALRKVLASAMANARENHGIDPENLRIANIMVDEGPHMKRMIARAMGRGNRIVKKTSHITVVVEEFEAPIAVKPHGTTSKPRPKFKSGTEGRRSGSKVSPASAKSKKDDVVAGEEDEEETTRRGLEIVFGAPMKLLDTSDLEDGIRMVFGMKLGSKDGVVTWTDESNDAMLAGELKRTFVDVTFALHKETGAYRKERRKAQSNQDDWLVCAWKEDDGSVCTLREHPENDFIVGHWRFRSRDEQFLVDHLRPIADDWNQSLTRLRMTVRGILNNAKM